MNRRRFMASAASLAAAAAVPAPAFAERPIPLSGDDPLGVRGDFPILENGRVFLNSAYIAPTPRQVVAAGTAFQQMKAIRAMSVGELLGAAGAVCSQFAALVHAEPDEVGFVYATSEGENTVANNAPMSPGDSVVIDDLHYDGAIVAYRELERRRGIELRIVANRGGIITPDDIARRVDGRTRLVAVSYVSSVNGLRHDIRALADIAHSHGALLHADAIQAVGMFPIDVRADDMDSMCAGTYKWLLGGFGVAPFYMKRSVIDRVPTDRFGIFQVAEDLPDHHFALKKTARRYNYATLPFAEVHQLGAALTYLQNVGVDRIATHTLGLTRRLERGLLEQGYRLFTPAGNGSAVLCFFHKQGSADVAKVFSETRIDLTVRDDHSRASIALFNNSDDIDRLLEATKRLA
ncbi:MAG TPA: aminotransferase class V-fold PLP-dependent enzyme [Gemmatimonadaceae bacterium]|jgi:selenocysteine lyase/cysteine desulfurase|nr:aminotransferase class V-fold PLP-dependent enzyme [Gemmatimonadaceae bacterium]